MRGEKKMRYEVYSYKTMNSRGKFIGEASTREEAINLGAEYHGTGFFDVFDTKKNEWLDF